jgi:hypothetical protein
LFDGRFVEHPRAPLPWSWAGGVTSTDSLQKPPYHANELVLKLS